MDVLVDVKDANTVIPRNSVIEANQSGLIATPLIDITPQLPIPVYKVQLLYLEFKSHAMGIPDVFLVPNLAAVDQGSFCKRMSNCHVFVWTLCMPKVHTHTTDLKVEDQD